MIGFSIHTVDRDEMTGNILWKSVDDQAIQWTCEIPNFRYIFIISYFTRLESIMDVFSQQIPSR